MLAELVEDGRESKKIGLVYELKDGEPVKLQAVRACFEAIAGALEDTYLEEYGWISDRVGLPEMGAMRAELVGVKDEEDSAQV
jgi:hypothetical protein